VDAKIVGIDRTGHRVITRCYQSRPTPGCLLFPSATPNSLSQGDIVALPWVARSALSRRIRFGWALCPALVVSATRAADQRRQSARYHFRPTLFSTPPGKKQRRRAGERPPRGLRLDSGGSTRSSIRSREASQGIRVRHSQQIVQNVYQQLKSSSRFIRRRSGPWCRASLRARRRPQAAAP